MMSSDWVKRPQSAHLPVLVCIPHFGTQALPGITEADYAERAYATFPYGFADAFAAELYGTLASTGATLLAFPFSRLFVDVNRPRDDYEVRDGYVYSQRGVVRTHTVANTAIFAHPLSQATTNARLAAYYDPYHGTLTKLIDRAVVGHERLVVLDAHTGSERGMGTHQIVVGTRDNTTASKPLAQAAERVFESHGFSVHHDLPGYRGGFTVRHYAAPRTRNIHAVQIEVNSSLLMSGDRAAFMAQVRRGERPNADAVMLAKLRTCMEDVIVALAAT